MRNFGFVSIYKLFIFVVFPLFFVLFFLLGSAPFLKKQQKRPDKLPHRMKRRMRELRTKTKKFSTADEVSNSVVGFVRIAKDKVIKGNHENWLEFPK